MAAVEPKDRLHLAMPPKTKQCIDDLQARTSSGLMSETIRRALILLDAVSKTQEKGGELFVHWQDESQIQVIITS